MSTTVVGAAVVRRGRVLAARRTRPADLAGRWELPGGKVEQGESEPAALGRELREELQLHVEVGELIGRVPMGRHELAVYLCEPAGEPRLGEDHDQLRWLSGADLESVDWLDADRAVLPSLAERLAI